MGRLRFHWQFLIVSMLTTTLLVMGGFKVSSAKIGSAQPVLADTVTKTGLIKGTLTKALEGPSGHVYPVGTEVAKVVFGTAESDPSTPYYLSLTSDAEGNINALGEIPARYVQSSNDLQDVTDQKSTTLLDSLVNDFKNDPDGTTDGTNSPGLDIGNGDESSFTVYTGDLTKCDTSKLKALLAQAKSALAVPSSYTAGLDALQAAVVDAEAVLNDKQMSQDGIDLVSDELDDALNGGGLTVNLDQLNKWLKRAKSYLSAKSKYKSITKLQKAYQEVNDEGLSQYDSLTDIQDAIKRLSASITQLKLYRVNVKQLRAVITRANKLKRLHGSKYHIHNFRVDLGNAKKIAYGNSASQQKVNKVYDVLVRDMKYVSGKKAKAPQRRTCKAPARKVTHKRRQTAHKKVVKKVANSRRSSRKVVKKAKKSKESKKATPKAKKHVAVKRHK